MRSFNNVELQEGSRKMKLERAMGGLMVALGIVGFLAIGAWLGQMHLVWPEDTGPDSQIPMFIGCLVLIVVGGITLGGRFWLKYPKVIIFYIFAFASGFVALYLAYAARNDTLLETAVSVLGIILVIMTSVAILTRKYSTNTRTMISKGIVVLILIPFLVGMAGYVMPQWFDGISRAFPDPNLRAAVRDAVWKPVNSIGSIGYARRSDLVKLTKLETYCETYCKSISDLTGLQYCTGLTELDLSLSYQIHDITPISNLTGLTRLDLSGNNIHDIRPLEHLTNLTTLVLSSNEINDLGPLGNLTNLVSLSLTWNNITDISPLLQIKTLKTVVMYSNPLNAESVNVYIPQLRQRGVSVVYY
jgi:FtsH-binding integral membrane protein